MKKMMLATAALLVAGVAYAGAPEGHGKPADAGKPAATPASAAAAATPATAAAWKPVKGEGMYAKSEELKWDAPFGPQGPQFAFAVGDMKTKNKQTNMFMKFPAGFDSGWHTHDGEYAAVVVKGSMTHQVQGGVEHKLAQGSYWTQPGKVNHRNVCLADGGECIVYGSMPKGFSFTPKTAEGKDVPKEPAKASGGSH